MLWRALFSLQEHSSYSLILIKVLKIAAKLFLREILMIKETTEGKWSLFNETFYNYVRVTPTLWVPMASFQPNQSLQVHNLKNVWKWRTLPTFNQPTVTMSCHQPGVPIARCTSSFNRCTHTSQVRRCTQGDLASQPYCYLWDNMPGYSFWAHIQG